MTVRGTAAEGFPLAVGPEDLDGVHVAGLPQAEVQARVIAAEETAAGCQAAQPAAVRRSDSDLGAVGVAVEGGVHDAKDEPVAAVRGNVPVEASTSGDVGDEQIEGALVAEVADCQAAPDLRGPAQVRIVRRDIAKVPLAVVDEELVPFAVGRPVRSQGGGQL